MERLRTWKLRLWAISLTSALVTGGYAGAAEDPIVIGMSYGAVGDAEMRGTRMMSGVKAFLARVNAAGGIHGRPVLLEIMDDHGVPSRHVENMKRLAREKRVVAFIGCVGDETCLAAAGTAAELRIPLLAPLSGRTELSRQRNPYVFRVRADYNREADAIAKQLQQLGCNQIALLSEGLAEPEPTMRRAMEALGLKVDVIRLDASAGSMNNVLSKLAAGRYEAAFLNLNLQTVERLVDAGLADRPEWPRVLMTIANGNLQPLIGNFKGRVVGFTQVVPNPDLLAHPLSRELNQDAERYSGGKAITYDGMETYIGARVLVEALRKAGPKLGPDRLAQALATADGWTLPNFRVNFRDGLANGSDWVEIGLRSRTGALVN